jgi:ribosomal protein L17
MRHHNNVRKFGRKKNGRNALLKGLALSLIARGRIETTEAKAKVVKIRVMNKNISFIYQSLLFGDFFLFMSLVPCSIIFICN